MILEANVVLLIHKGEDSTIQKRLLIQTLDWGRLMSCKQKIAGDVISLLLRLHR